MKKNGSFKKFIMSHERFLLLGVPLICIFAALLFLVVQIHEIKAQYSVLEDSYEAVSDYLAEYVPPEEPQAPIGTAPPQSVLLSPGLSTVDGKIKFTDANGVTADSLGVDVSFYNGLINWDAVRDAGIDFALIRLGGRGWGQGGNLYSDVRFSNYLNEASLAGLKTGVYFYTAASNIHEARREAEYLLTKLNGAELSMPVFLDVEFSGNYPAGRADDLEISERVAVIRAFSDIIERAGYKTGVYLNEYFLTSEVDYSSLSDLSIWIASYTEGNAKPAVSMHYDIWQFTDSARIAGISGSCDLNAVFPVKEAEPDA